jgi:ParB-like chromosome segregation protein Spo0J
VPELSLEEYESLKESIKKNGLYMPLIVNLNRVLLDGHHRYKACQELNIKSRLEVKTFNDPIYEKLFVVHANLKRRQLTDAQKVELGDALKPIYEEIAKRNSLSNLRQNLNVSSDRNKDDNESKPGGH